MIAPQTSNTVCEAIRIPYVAADEALVLLRTELDRFLALVETLEPADWAKPTACTLWTVRDILAHQAGGYASGTWMHRLDICRATGRKFEQSSGHDDRITALVILDVAKALPAKLNNRAILFELSGLAGGVWKIGTGEPAASIQMDALDFNTYASGRYTYGEACSKSSLNGDVDLAKLALKKTAVLY